MRMVSRIRIKILIFGKAFVKIPSFDLSKVEMFVIDLSDSEDKMSLKLQKFIYNRFFQVTGIGTDTQFQLGLVIIIIHAVVFH